MKNHLKFMIAVILNSTVFSTACIAADQINEPFGDLPSTHGLQKSSLEPDNVAAPEEESTQEWLENLLRANGRLKEGQHLLPHQVWRLADKVREVANKKRLAAAH